MLNYHGEAYENREYQFNGNSYTYIPNESHSGSIRNREENQIKDGTFVFDGQGTFLYGEFNLGTQVGTWLTYDISNITYNDEDTHVIRKDSFDSNGKLILYEEFGIYSSSSFLTKRCSFLSGKFDCSYPHTKLIHWYLKYLTRILGILGVLFVFRTILNFKIVLRREDSYSAARALAAFIFYWKERFSDEKRLVILANSLNALTALLLIGIVAFHIVIKNAIL